MSLSIVKIMALKSLSDNPDTRSSQSHFCSLSFLLRMSCIFLFIPVFHNLNLYPGPSEWYVVGTLDAVLFLSRVLIFFLIRQLIWLNLDWKFCLPGDGQQLKYQFSSFRLEWDSWSLVCRYRVQGSRMETICRSLWNSHSQHFLLTF